MAENHEFVRGFGIAIANLMRLHSSDTEAYDVLTGAGFTIADFAKAGLEEYDLAELRVAFAMARRSTPAPIEPAGRSRRDG